MARYILKAYYPDLIQHSTQIKHFMLIQIRMVTLDSNGDEFLQQTETITVSSENSWGIIHFFIVQEGSGCF